MSLELLAQLVHWNPDVSVGLCMVVREQIYARKAIVFQEGEPASAAYHVLDGNLILHRSDDPEEWDSEVSCMVCGQDVVPGNWVGEAALINTNLRRDGTCASLDLTKLLAIDGQEFKDMLQKYGMSERYMTFLREDLWKGMCGRCGTLGHHFTENCARRHTAKRNEFKISGWRSMTGDSAHSDEEHTMARDLVLYLQEYELEALAPVLRRGNILRLENLDAVWGSPGIHDWIAEVQMPEEKMVNFNHQGVLQFQQKARRLFRPVLEYGSARNQHWLFLSHVKAEAGIEASLMRTELEQLISEDSTTEARVFEVPVFLDLEDLNTLTELKDHVKKSHNIALLLTPSTLLRPWILVEIATAFKENIPILPVQINRPDSKLFVPGEDFYQKLLSRDVLDAQGEEVITQAGFDLKDVEHGIRRAFKHISLEYSPQRSADIRKAELQKLLRNCAHNISGR